MKRYYAFLVSLLTLQISYAGEKRVGKNKQAIIYTIVNCSDQKKDIYLDMSNNSIRISGDVYFQKPSKETVVSRIIVVKNDRKEITLYRQDGRAFFIDYPINNNQDENRMLLLGLIPIKDEQQLQKVLPAIGQKNNVSTSGPQSGQGKSRNCTIL